MYTTKASIKTALIMHKTLIINFSLTYSLFSFSISEKYLFMHSSFLLKKFLTYSSTVDSSIDVSASKVGISLSLYKLFKVIPFSSTLTYLSSIFLSCIIFLQVGSSSTSSSKTGTQLILDESAHGYP